MKKIAVTKELLDIANQLDSMKMYQEANVLTRIANIVVAEDLKQDPMIYNPDDAASDDLDAKASDLDNLIDALRSAQTEGDLSEEDIHSIMNILEQESGKKSYEMSFDEDDDFDPNYGDDSDYDDEDPGDPNAWQYEDDEDDDMLDREHRQHGGGYHHHEDNED